MSVMSGFSRTRRRKMYVVSGFSRTRRRTLIREDIERRPVATPQAEVGAFEEAPVVVTTASEADAPAWDAFVHRQRGATGYHEWAWHRVFERAFGHRSLYLIARQHDRVGRR